MMDERELREEAEPFLCFAFLPILWAIRTRLPDGERLTIREVRERLQVRTLLQDIAKAANIQLIAAMPELISTDFSITNEIVEINLQALSEILGDECKPDDYLKVMAKGNKGRIAEISKRATDILIERYRKNIQWILNNRQHGQS